MAKIKPRTTPAPREPMSQAEATRLARRHPEVIKAKRRYQQRVRKLGHDPEDPRWILSDEAARGDSTLVKLAAAFHKTFNRVRDELRA